MNTARDLRIRIAGILILTFLRFTFVSSDMIAGTIPFSKNLMLVNLVMSFVTSVVMWEANRWVVIYLNRYAPARKLSLQEFGKEALYIIALNTIIYAIFIAAMILLEAESKPPLVYLAVGLIDRIIYGFIVAGLYELLLFIEALRSSRKETEELKKINVTIQLESLKNQVKPHFLFNSLNTLTGLVEQDPSKAVKFIAELSTVYRYLLQSNDKEVIALAEELKFTEAYFFLLRTRFADGIVMNVSIESEAEQFLIPPLTLQMLVENALKHNQVSARTPLVVDIRLEDDQWLVVENNLQPKRNPVSNGMGLANIAAKFRLLNEPAVQVMKDDKTFQIKVPLIKVKHQ